MKRTELTVNKFPPLLSFNHEDSHQLLFFFKKKISYCFVINFLKWRQLFFSPNWIIFVVYLFYLLNMILRLDCLPSEWVRNDVERKEKENSIFDLINFDSRRCFWKKRIRPWVSLSCVLMIKVLSSLNESVRFEFEIWSFEVLKEDD